MTFQVVIPLYTNLLQPYEAISIQRAFACFEGNITLVIPQGFKPTHKLFTHLQYNIQYFEPAYFNGIAGYNKLLLTPQFYQAFINYTFILIYQPDCYVFNPTLQPWLSKGYSYIGAPWFWDSFYPKPQFTKKTAMVGNGGLSLRNVTHCLAVLKGNKAIKYNHNTYLIKQRGQHQKWVKRNSDNAQQYIKDAVNLRPLTAVQYIAKHPIIEDVFWSIVAPQYNSNFNVSPLLIGMQFCFEAYPELCYQLNNKQLPFGAHAWWRYNLSFYTPFIVADGYTL